MPTEVAKIRREHVETFVEDLLAKWKPATTNNRYRALAQFFKWALEEGEITDSPMARMKPPTVPDAPVSVVSDDELRSLLRACQGSGFEERRDTAIVRLLVDTGMRAAELMNLKVEDLDLDVGAALTPPQQRVGVIRCQSGAPDRPLATESTDDESA